MALVFEARRARWSGSAGRVRSGSTWARTELEETAVTVMTGFVGRIEESALQNEDFRRVMYTAPHSQVVLMCLEPLEQIGMELHADTDQFFRIEQGQGTVILAGESHPISHGDAIVVPAGTEHNIINASASERLHLLTIYSPPAHKDGVIHRMRAEAVRDDDDRP
jgi:mannose-6-phosphate isomerase-like protein (cupin superfamily)